MGGLRMIPNCNAVTIEVELSSNQMPLRATNTRGVSQRTAHPMTTPNHTSEIPQKKCTKCGRELPASSEYFHREKAKKGGLSSHCKECRRQASRDYYTAHKEKRRVSFAAYHKEHREKISAQHKARYLARREKKRAYNTSYRSANRERLNAYRAIYEVSYSASPRGKAIRKAAYHRRRARKLFLPDTLTAIDLQRAHEYWGGICPCCGKQIYDLFGEVKPNADHWIPLTSPECPGTVPWNMIPLCNRCNSSKSNKNPEVWLAEKFGKRRAVEILERINRYFEYIKSLTNGR